MTNEERIREVLAIQETREKHLNEIANHIVEEVTAGRLNSEEIAAKWEEIEDMRKVIERETERAIEEITGHAEETEEETYRHSEDFRRESEEHMDAMVNEIRDTVERKGAEAAKAVERMFEHNSEHKLDADHEDREDLEAFAGIDKKEIDEMLEEIKKELEVEAAHVAGEMFDKVKDSIYHLIFKEGDNKHNNNNKIANGDFVVDTIMNRFQRRSDKVDNEERREVNEIHY